MPAPSGRHTGAVDKMAGELQQRAATVLEQSTAAPLTPNPLPKVTTSNSGFTFFNQQVPRPCSPDNARAVGIIDHQPAIVLLRYLLDFRQWRTIAVHAEHAFRHHQLLPRTGG